MALDILEYYNMIKKHNVNIIYSGPIWADGIEGIAETLKRRLEFDELPLHASRSVFSVFAEQMNNVLMYSEEKEAHKSSGDKTPLNVSKGVFILGVHDGKYFMQSGNIIDDNSVELIKSKIDYLNTLDKEQLRNYYKEQIKSKNPNPKSKGAGLGLIEIARRADSKIDYVFTPLEDGTTFFTMSVSIGGRRD